MVSLLSSISSEVSLVQVLTASDVRTFENWRNWIVLHETYYVNRRWKKSDNLWKLRFSIRKFQVIQEILKKCCFREKMLAAYPNVYLRRITLHLKDAFRYIKFRIYKTIVPRICNKKIGVLVDPNTQILNGTFFNANKTYANVINTNAWKKCIWLITNQHNLAEKI